MTQADTSTRTRLSLRNYGDERAEQSAFFRGVDIDCLFFPDYRFSTFAVAESCLPHFLYFAQPLIILIVNNISIESVEIILEVRRSRNNIHAQGTNHAPHTYARLHAYTHRAAVGTPKQSPTRTHDGMYQRITRFPRFYPIPFVENTYHPRPKKVLLLRGRTPYRGHGVGDIEKSIYIP